MSRFYEVRTTPSCVSWGFRGDCANSAEHSEPVWPVGNTVYRFESPLHCPKLYHDGLSSPQESSVRESQSAPAAAGAPRRSQEGRPVYSGRSPSSGSVGEQVTAGDGSASVSPAWWSSHGRSGEGPLGVEEVASLGAQAPGFGETSNADSSQVRLTGMLAISRVRRPSRARRGGHSGPVVQFRSSFFPGSRLCYAEQRTVPT